MTLTNIYGTFSFGYDADDELTTYNNAAYTFGYNPNGDLNSSTLNGHLSTLTYDYDDQLTSIASQAGTVSYLYDALGRRVSRTDASNVTHSFVFDGSNLVAEYNDNTGTWDKEYTWGHDILDKQGGTNGTEFPLYNGLGDVYQSLTASGSYVLSADIFDDYGQNFGGTSGSVDIAYQWRGSSGYRSEGDGLWQGSYNEPLVQVGARYYLSSMGVFITRDTDLSQKPYEYCNADPVNHVDPSGHAPGDGLRGKGNSPASNTASPDAQAAAAALQQAIDDYLAAAALADVSSTSQAITDSSLNVGAIALIAGAVSCIPGVDVLTGPFALTLGGVSGAEFLLGEYWDSIVAFFNSSPTVAPGPPIGSYGYSNPKYD